jgi:DNA repair exonuclease SbcCD ATPase subunit
MSESIKPRCAKCQDWRMTKNEEAVTIVNGTALCSWHAKEGGMDEVASLRTALTESRREVERLKAEASSVEWTRKEEQDRLRINRDLVAEKEAENATLRQEVEATRAINERYQERDVHSREHIAHLIRQVTEQAAKLAEQDGRIDRLCESGEQARMDLITERNARMIAESYLAAAQERIKELEERLPHYHNEKQCGVIAERIERAESSLASMTRERDDYRWKYEAETNRIGVTRLNEFNALKAELERVTKERDEADGWGEEWKRIATEKCDRIKVIRAERDAAQAALRAKESEAEGLRKAARSVLAYPNIQKFMGSILFDGLMSAITYTPSPADGEPSFTMEELKAMKAKLDEPFPAPSEPKEGA